MRDIECDRVMDSTTIILVYTFLGLMAFSAPKFVHEAKDILNLLDKLSMALLILYILADALSFQFDKAIVETNSFIINSLIGVIALLVYLFYANISR